MSKNAFRVISVLLVIVTSALATEQDASINGELSQEVFSAKVSQVKEALKKLESPLEQVIIDHNKDGSLSRKFESLIVPDQDTVITSFELHFRAGGKVGRSVYAYVDGQFFVKLGSSDKWVPVSPKSYKMAVDLTSRALTLASVENLIASHASPLEDLVKKVGGDSPDALVQLLDRIDNIQKADKKEDRDFSFADGGISIRGKKMLGRSEIESLEDFRDGVLASTVTSEIPRLENFKRPEVTNFVDVRIGDHLIKVAPNLISNPPEECGALVDLVNGKLYVLAVRPNSTAAEAGFQVGDEILSFNGAQVPDLNQADLMSKFRTFKAGPVDVFGVDGKRKSLALK